MMSKKDVRCPEISEKQERELRHLIVNFEIVLSVRRS